MTKSYSSRTGGIFVLAFTLTLFCWAGLARAVDGPAAAPFKFAVVSAASIKDLTEASNEIGMSLPPFLTAAGLEQTFEFIGKDGIDPDRPIGMIFCLDPAAARDAATTAIIVLPVKETAATIDVLAKLPNVAPVEGHPDTLIRENMTFRRIDGYVMFGQATAAVETVTSQDLAAAYKARAGMSRLIADTSADIKTVRAMAPRLFRAFISNARENGDVPKDANEKMGQEWVLNAMGNLDSIRMGLAHSQNDLEIILGLAPADVGTPGTFPKPGMPADVSLRIDCTSHQLLHSSALAVDAVIKNVATDEHWTAEQTRMIHDAKQSFDDLFVNESAVSIGVVVAGDNSRVYMVEQREQPLDVPATMKLAIDRFMKLNDLDKTAVKSTAEMSSYEEGGLKVTRVALADGPKPVAYIDAVAKGNLVYITGAADDGHHMADIASLQPAGQINGVLSGQVELLPVYREAMKAGGPPMSAEKKKAMHDLLNGKSISFLTLAEKDGITVKVKVATSVVKGIVDMIMSPEEVPAN